VATHGSAHCSHRFTPVTLKKQCLLVPCRLVKAAPMHSVCGGGAGIPGMLPAPGLLDAHTHTTVDPRCRLDLERHTPSLSLSLTHSHTHTHTHTHPWRPGNDAASGYLMSGSTTSSAAGAGGLDHKAVEAAVSELLALSRVTEEYNQVSN
jgi:hypothetical protein